MARCVKTEHVRFRNAAGFSLTCWTDQIDSILERQIPEYACPDVIRRDQRRVILRRGLYWLIDGHKVREFDFEETTT